MTKAGCRTRAIVATGDRDIAVTATAAAALMTTTATMAATVSTAVTATMVPTARTTPVVRTALSHVFILFSVSFTLLSRVSKLAAHLS
jgi:hypothetical protein